MTKREALLENASPIMQLGILLVLVLSGIMVGSFIGAMLLEPLFGLNMLSNPEVIDDLSNENSLYAQRFFILIQQVFGFLIPTILMTSWISRKRTKLLMMDTLPLKQLALIPLIFIVAFPLINFSYGINQLIELPEYFKNMEQGADRIVEAIVYVDSIPSLLINILIIGILPAVCEEFLFRGILQRLFYKRSKNIHLAIIMTAFWFSFVHFQFSGFIPRFLMGLLFGYLLIWSGSIWLPMLIHAINNSLAVIFGYLIKKGSIPSSVEELGMQPSDYVIVGGAIIGIGFLLYYYRKLNRSKNIYA